MSIRITMTEMVVYSHDYPTEEVRNWFDLPADSTEEDVLQALEDADLDVVLLDEIMQHFVNVPERDYDWTSSEAAR